MSTEPKDLLAIALIAAGLVTLMAALATFRRGRPRSFARTTMLFMGIALTQLATLAGAQTQSRHVFQVGFLGAFLFLLAVGAFIEARRETRQGVR